jgi:hypothetical protein
MTALPAKMDCWRCAVATGFAGILLVFRLGRMAVQLGRP